MWPGMWVTSRTGSVGWDLRKVSELRLRPGTRPDKFCALRALHVGAGGADEKVSIERWYLSPYVKKPLNSKVIKFRTWTKKLFRDSYVIYVRYEHYMYMSHIHVWLCNAMNVLDMILNNLMVRLVILEFWEMWSTPFAHCSQVHSDPEW